MYKMAIKAPAWGHGFGLAPIGVAEVSSVRRRRESEQIPKQNFQHRHLLS